MEESGGGVRIELDLTPRVWDNKQPQHKSRQGGGREERSETQSEDNEGNRKRQEKTEGIRGPAATPEKKDLVREGLTHAPQDNSNFYLHITQPVFPPSSGPFQTSKWGSVSQVQQVLSLFILLPVQALQMEISSWLNFVQCISSVWLIVLCIVTDN